MTHAEASAASRATRSRRNLLGALETRGREPTAARVQAHLADQKALEHVLQLSDVAGPATRGQIGQEAGIERGTGEPQPVGDARQLSFWAERWTRRSPFAFRIDAYRDGEWTEVFDGGRRDGFLGY